MDTPRTFVHGRVADLVEDICSDLALVGRAEVLDLCAFGSADLRRMLRNKTFPESIQLAPRKHAYLAAEVRAVFNEGLDGPDHRLQRFVKSVRQKRLEKIQTLDHTLVAALQKSSNEQELSTLPPCFPWMPLKSICTEHDERPRLSRLPCSYGVALNQRRTGTLFPVRSILVGGRVYVNAVDVTLWNIGKVFAAMMR